MTKREPEQKNHSLEQIHSYIDKVAKQYQTGIARELAYRGYLETLLEELAPGVVATSDAARIECGAPDYIVTRKNIPIGYIEAKDVGKPLEAKEYKEQFDRYKSSLGNLIITDYLDFWLYRDGELVSRTRIGGIVDNKIASLPEAFETFADVVVEFAAHAGRTITSAPKLSKMMAGKARLLSNIIENAVSSDERSEADSSLKQQMAAFRKILIHDITTKEFADIYAQTIAYGMFAARLHDKTLDNFSRQEAAELIPKSNPFLRNLFGYIAGPNLDDRIRWVVDALADIFRATDVAKILKSFGKSTQKRDPIIHFYETFLSEYDPKLRKSRGVWYTPEPVVHYIVQAVDDTLKKEFGLKDGIADTSKIKITEDTQVRDKRYGSGYKQVKIETHKVQVLDPAVGTGTFLADITKKIYGQFAGQEGAWGNYVEEHLIPRLHGFEILMASYAMAHLKMDLLLQDTGYQSAGKQRFRVFLTNSLEEHHPDTGTLFASWLSTEATEANHVKRDTPVMVVLGNPPYSGISSNMGEWISSLIEDYKYVDGEHFGEKKHWLHDDYVKFLRYGQFLIDKNGEGVVAYINNHSFLDNPTFRGMRWSLLESFDKIYVLDLHGNTKKKETPPDGLVDQNVFDIQQGVSINLFIKTNKKKVGELAKVYHADLWGDRKRKYEFLWEGRVETTGFTQLAVREPFYFFVPRQEKLEDEFNQGISVDELFPTNVSGVVTARDAVVVAFDKEALIRRIERFCDPEVTENELRRELFPEKKAGKYKPGDTRGWQLENARKAIADNDHEQLVIPYLYRPFDRRVVYYSPKMVDWGREQYMHHLLSGENLALIVPKQVSPKEDAGAFVSRSVGGHKTFSAFNINYYFPLYLYADDVSQVDIDQERERRKPNVGDEAVARFEEALDLKYSETAEKGFCAEQLFDYTYAVVNAPSYRQKFGEMLKNAFPRVPLPTNIEFFLRTVELGRQLRQVHLLEEELEPIASFPVVGSNKVDRRMNKKDFVVAKADPTRGRAWINDEQYFDDIPVSIWERKVGGFQPAQRWLKDRVGQVLSYEDIKYYQSVLAALDQTQKLLEEIDVALEIA